MAFKIRGGCLRSASFEHSISTPLPNVPQSKGIANGSFSLRTSSLPNGVRVVTASNPTHAISSLGVYVQTGPRFETSENHGATYLLKQLAFRNHDHLSSLKLIRGLEDAGAQFSVVQGREYISYQAHVEPNHLTSVVPLIASAVQPSYGWYAFEIKDAVEVAKEALPHDTRNPFSHVFEALHAEAYRNSGLGNSIHPHEFQLEKLDGTKISSFLESQYNSDAFTIVAVGDVNHDQIVNSFATELKTKKGNRKATPSKYYGGEHRQVADAEATFIGVGFQGVGLTDKDLPAAGALQYLLGGGKKFTREGPGAGFSSLLHKTIIEPSQDEFAQINTFNFNYSDSGLFGFYGTVSRQEVGNLFSKLKQQTKKLEEASLDSNEIARAKSQYKADILSSTDTRSGLLDHFGVLAGANGELVLPVDFAKKVDAVGAKEIAAVAKKIFSSKPTVTAFGDVSELPVF